VRLLVDRITKSLLDDFSTETGIPKLAEDVRFEHFATYAVVSRHYSDAFSTTDLVTGSGGDTGIDAIATLVNGVLIDDPDEVRELADTNGYVEATFVFVQAERSAGFDTQKIGQFGFGVADFFAENPKLPRNAQVDRAASIMSAVYAQSSKFKRGRPAARLFYVTTGRWTGDTNLEVRRKATEDDLAKLNIFGQIEFLPVDADRLHQLYRQTKNAITREFTFAHRAIVPEMPGVKEAHVGLVPAKEFLQLIDDGAGGVIKSIFYDNVRDWQDYNAVNGEMRDTLATAAGRARFALMNNGVTIIAKSVQPTANRFLIEDYQVVNGCQTSHVLFEQRALLDDSVFVPVRLIATTDEEVVAAVVKATNRQTEVKEEQLFALSDFQKKLESYFVSLDGPRRLYYERRSRQYGASSVEKTRIVTPTSLIRAYSSMFLEEPHRTTRSYRRLLERVGTDIFGREHRLEPYYLAASALYRLEFLFRSGAIDARFKAARYQILMAARLLANVARPPRSNSHEVARYADAITEKMWDTDASEALFQEAVRLVEKLTAGSLDNDTVRTEAFTDSLRSAATKRAAEIVHKGAGRD
jgi:hypothetical protein